MQKQVLSGNEAIARGVYEAACRVATAYPGTPSTEILENIAKQYSDSIYAQWACNEKVAFEIAYGASIGGVRAFCAFKHVGMNVAADPIFTAGYAGVNGGLVFVTADDPGCHSSQNEQDNRHYAPHTKICMMEPSDSQECLDYVKAAFEISEKFDTPVMIRMTTRICHSKSLVRIGNRKEISPVPYQRKAEKYAMLPGVARARHQIREDILLELESYANNCPYNFVESYPGNTVGVISSGISYQHSREVFGEGADYLKLGLSYPLPKELISEFAKKYKTLYVIEENDPYLENAVKSLGFNHVIGKSDIPICGELNATIIRNSLFKEGKNTSVNASVEVPPRAPTLCSGCPHRGFFYALSLKLNKVVPVGDIGCYSLGINPPFNGFDFSICMGAGFSALIGLSQALAMQGDSRKPLGMLGDSTFFHSGITGLIDIVASEANVIACILDNSITAMTGHQENPGTTKNLMGEPSPAISIEDLVMATGLDEKQVRIVDPGDLKAMGEALDDAISFKGPFIIITKSPCVLIKDVAKEKANVYCEIDHDKCIGCKMCMKIACPAISFSSKKATIVDPASCTACGLCMQMCKFDAIKRKDIRR